MIRLTRAPDLMLGQHWANLLRQAGISCRLTGVYLQGGAGEIPVDQCGPDLWIEHERDRDTAMRLIDGPAQGTQQLQSHWHCEACGEWLEPQFTVCWQCGQARPVDWCR
ncbi:DUF2007 domain-containing protein [Bordetella petrii]|uniref:putative signal transducing protein n=1 Tax=Bordetella petrii TaxID=94624 RepID=UPI001E3B4445|nr:DUF2007 domain-containing protein [Bordetella petrii]MCD0503844.1 DUF2007 domain-containing protein [Bordetella petrii]